MISKKAAALGAVVIILVTTFFSSFFTLEISKFIDVQKGDRVIVSREDYNLIQEYYSKLEQVRNDLEKNYIQKTDRDKLFEGAVKGMVASLGDPYSNYFTPEEMDDFKVAISGTYQGIGVSIEKSDDNLIMVVQVFRNSPAMEAGLLPGDKIVRVNGQDYDWSTYEQAVAIMKEGEPGSKLEVSVLRDGKIIDFQLTRAIVEMPDMEFRMLTEEIGYIWLYKFDGIAARNFKEAVAELQGQGMKGLILDLRGNPGGQLEICRNIGDFLLPEGLVVYSQDRKGNRTDYESDADYLGIPLVILVNQYSASASEVLAGAIQDHGVGTVIGTTTFGKGVVQTMRYYKDGSGLKLTTYKYFTPKGREIHEKGVTPDIHVELGEEARQFLKENPTKDLPLELDTQLNRGIEEITKKLEESLQEETGE